MISEVLLASYSYFGGGVFGDLLTRWEQMGFFSYVLPFLLIFSIVFGVLSKTRIFEDNKSINAIIALAVGFMALQWNLVPQFFSEIFPRVGVGIAVLLIMILFLGIFLPRQNWAIYVFFVIAAVIAITILLNSSEALGWQASFLPGLTWSDILFWVVLLGGIGAVIGSMVKRERPQFGDISSAFMKDMHK
jgi:hypothetical protein